jgi:hypothetical protein
MIGIKSKKSLARVLGLPTHELIALSEAPDQFVRHYTLYNPGKPDVSRDVIAVGGALRRCQYRLLRRVFSKYFTPSEYSHGIGCQRNIKTNAQRHLRSTWVFTTDISHFFPSIHRDQVYGLLFRDQGCSPNVAQLIARLCTHNHELAVGLVTSPMLADQIFRPVDLRLSAIAKSAGLVYTRYIDDISFSGSFDFADSGIPALVGKVLNEHGYVVRKEKHRMGRANDPSTSITQMRMRAGHLDVRREYVENLGERMSQLAALARGEAFVGEYVTRDQLAGRIRFVCWVNPGRGRALWREFERLNWKAIENEAAKRRFVVERAILIPRA